MRRTVLIALLVCALACSVIASEDHDYEQGESIPVWVNQVSPLDNPSETYAYYDLPFPCKPAEEVGPGPESLGEILEGDKFVLSPYQIGFMKGVEHASLCNKQKITKEQAEVLRDAVSKFSTFSMVIDELPAMSFIGYSESDVDASGAEIVRHYLNTHLDFSFGVNNGQIVEVNVTATDLENSRVELTDVSSDIELDFTYSVEWIQSDVEYADRIGHQNQWLLLMFSFGDTSAPSQIRWLSIMNAFILILFLVTFIALILLRILRRDYVKLEKLQQSPDEIEDAEDDVGWKRIHTQVFRYPPRKSVFASLVGVGAQFIALIFSLVFLVAMGVYSNYHSGALLATAIVLYALTAVIAGYVSATWFKRMDGEAWLSNLLLTTMLYAVPFWVVGAVLNTVALTYHSTRALPFGTIVAIIAIWGAIAFPLTMLGGLLGRRFSQPFKHPTETRLLPKGIPPQSWFQMLPVQMTVAGFLPFTAIYLEVYYIFSSVWGHRLYTLYGVLLLAFFVMVIVSACITLCLIYFQLAAEDYRWWWRSMLCGGSTALFVFLYSVYFYAYQSQMNGFFQAAFYFGTVSLACYAVFIMLGAIGYMVSHIFVNRIYSVIKTQ